MEIINTSWRLFFINTFKYFYFNSFLMHFLVLSRMRLCCYVHVFDMWNVHVIDFSFKLNKTRQNVSNMSKVQHCLKSKTQTKEFANVFFYFWIIVLKLIRYSTRTELSFYLSWGVVSKELEDAKVSISRWRSDKNPSIIHT